LKWRLSSWRTQNYVRYIALLLCVGVGYAELARWVETIPSPSKLEAVFFRAVALPTGAVEIRRPPKETRVELTKLITAAPSEADLYALRAREDEQQLDFTAAESDWKKSGRLPDLADFYDRRIRPKDEIAVLESIAKTPSPEDRLTHPSEQKSWKAYERILNVIREQALPDEFTVNAYRAWIARYPTEQPVYERFLSYLADKKQFDDAEKLVADYRKVTFAEDPYPIQAEATIAWKRGALGDAIKIYDQSFRPLWPAGLVKSYFDLLKELKAQRDELTTAWTAAVSLIFGLNKSLELIHAEGLPQVYARHALMAEATRDAAAALKLKLIAPDNPAPGVTGILVPEGLDGGKLVKFLRDNLGVSVQGGQDQMKGKLVRIGHMGHLSPFDTLIAVSALEMGLKHIGANIQLGAGVAAVQARLARSI